MVVYYWVYILWVLRKDFPPPLSEVKTKKEKKTNEKYKPLNCYGQTCIPFDEFTLVRTFH